MPCVPHCSVMLGEVSATFGKYPPHLPLGVHGFSKWEPPRLIFKNNPHPIKILIVVSCVFLCFVSQLPWNRNNKVKFVVGGGSSLLLIGGTVDILFLKSHISVSFSVGHLFWIYQRPIWTNPRKYWRKLHSRVWKMFWVYFRKSLFKLTPINKNYLLLYLEPLLSLFRSNPY